MVSGVNSLSSILARVVNAFVVWDLVCTAISNECECMQQSAGLRHCTVVQPESATLEDGSMGAAVGGTLEGCSIGCMVGAMLGCCSINSGMEHWATDVECNIALSMSIVASWLWSVVSEMGGVEALDGSDEFVCSSCDCWAGEVVVSEFDGITDAERPGVFDKDLIAMIVFKSGQT